MADVDVDIVANDKTFAGVSAANRNLDRLDTGLRKAAKGTAELDRSMRGAAKAVGDNRTMMARLEDGLAKLPGPLGSVSAFLGPTGTLTAGMLALSAGAGLATGALVVGFGGALIATAVMAQKSNAEVQASFSALRQHVVDETKAMTAGFAPTLVHAADSARRAFDGLTPSLDTAFAAIGRGVDKLLPHLESGIEAFGPTIEAMGRSFESLSTTLGPAMQTALASTADGLTAIADVVAEHPDVFAGWVESTGQLIGGTEKLLAKLVELRGTELESGTPPEVLAQYQAAIALRDAQAEATRRMNEAEAEWVGRQRAALAAEQAHQTQLQNLGKAMLGLRSDQAAVEAALDGATTALKENGKTLDVHTVKGRANRAALDQIAAATLAWRDDTRNAGRSVVEQNQILDRGRGQLIRTAQQFGLTRDQARRYADTVLGIPRNWSTKIRADAAQAQETARETRRLIAGIPNRTVFIRAVRTGAFNDNTSSRNFAAGGVIREHVVGVGMQSGARYNIGEAGPEAIVPLRGRSSSRPTPAGSGAGTVINLSVNVGAALADDEAIGRAVMKALQVVGYRGLGPAGA